jgi:hypothetical protein
LISRGTWLHWMIHQQERGAWAKMLGLQWPQDRHRFSHDHIQYCMHQVHEETLRNTCKRWATRQCHTLLLSLSLSHSPSLAHKQQCHTAMLGPSKSDAELIVAHGSNKKEQPAKAAAARIRVSQVQLQRNLLFVRRANNGVVRGFVIVHCWQDAQSVKAAGMLHACLHGWSGLVC